MSRIKVLIVILCLQMTYSTKFSQDTYRAAVVEFGISFSGDLQQYFESNTARYKQLIQEAATQNVDIIVFPESTLNYGFTADRERIITYALELPEVDENIAPCDSDDFGTILKTLSCAARDGHLYVVVNLSEKLACDRDSQAAMMDSRPCHRDQHYLFNSNLVFNRAGMVVSKYRKTHLFGEVAFNTTARPELETFHTDFGVEFGHLICFDLQYQVPAQLLLKNGVTNFLLPLMWYSELPFLTAVQYQEAWAYASNANLLASGASSPLSGSGGSGIFSGRQGAKTSLMSGDTTTRLLIADLYKDPDSDPGTERTTQIDSENIRRMNLLKDHLSLYSVRFLEPETLAEGATEQICYGEFCCSFNITVSLYDKPNGSSYEYALVAFRGVRTYSGVASGGVENCGIVACTSKERDSCGMRFSQFTVYNPYVIFEAINLTGDFTLDSAAQYPTSLTGAMLPLPTDQFAFNSSTIDNKNHLTVNLTHRQEDLLTFGVFGRVFSIDCDPVTGQDSSMWMNIINISDNAYDIFKNDKNITNASEDVYDYIWSKFRILLIVVGVYILEML